MSVLILSYVLQGVSGAGRTTLMDVLSGRLPGTLVTRRCLHARLDSGGGV